MTKVDRILAHPHRHFRLVDGYLQIQPGALDGLSLEQLAEVADYYKAIATILRLEPPPADPHGQVPPGTEPTEVGERSAATAETAPETGGLVGPGADPGAHVDRPPQPQPRPRRPNPHPDPQVNSSLTAYVTRTTPTFEWLQRQIQGDAERGFERLRGRGRRDFRDQLR